MSRFCCSIWADEETPRRTGARAAIDATSADALTATDRPSAADREATLTVSDWLALAASPTFAGMALLTSATDGPAEMLCSSALGMPLSGMVVMYLLMSAFHLAPWLKLVRQAV